MKKSTKLFKKLIRKEIKKSLLKEGNVWERGFGEPLPTLKSVQEKHEANKKRSESQDDRADRAMADIDAQEERDAADIKSDILDTWKDSDVAQADLESFLKMLYDDGNYDTMEDFKSMFGVLSKLANDYYKNMRLG